MISLKQAKSRSIIFVWLPLPPVRQETAAWRGVSAFKAVSGGRGGTEGWQCLGYLLYCTHFGLDGGDLQNYGLFFHDLVVGYLEFETMLKGVWAKVWQLEENILYGIKLFFYQVMFIFECCFSL